MPLFFSALGAIVPGGSSPSGAVEARVGHYDRMGATGWSRVASRNSNAKLAGDPGGAVSNTRPVAYIGFRLRTCSSWIPRDILPLAAVTSYIERTCCSWF